jgi:hypothetical protein
MGLNLGGIPSLLDAQSICADKVDRMLNKRVEKLVSMGVFACDHESFLVSAARSPSSLLSRAIHHDASHPQHGGFSPIFRARHSKIFSAVFG